MNTKDALKAALDFNHRVLTSYLGDMTDADLLVRPVPAANHIAWQLGHLIESEQQMLGAIPGATVPELPAGFKEQHGKATAAAEPVQGFLKKTEYLALLAKMREATQAALARIPDTDLDRPSPAGIARIAPTVGAVFLLAANHELMHAGQFAVVRRKLGKPVLM